VSADAAVEASVGASFVHWRGGSTGREVSCVRSSGVAGTLPGAGLEDDEGDGDIAPAGGAAGSAGLPLVSIRPPPPQAPSIAAANVAMNTAVARFWRVLILGIEANPFDVSSLR